MRVSVAGRACVDGLAAAGRPCPDGVAVAVGRGTGARAALEAG